MKQLEQLEFLGNALANLRTPEQITKELDKINKIVLQGEGFFLTLEEYKEKQEVA